MPAFSAAWSGVKERPRPGRSAQRTNRASRSPWSRLSRARVVGSDVLIKAELAVRLQHAAGLVERLPWIRNRAQHEAEDDGVEGVVFERQRHGFAVDDLDSNRTLCQAPLGSGAHGRFRLERDDPV